MLPSRVTRRIWNYLGPIAALLLLVTLVLTLWEPISYWLQGEERYDREAIEEWIQESRIRNSLSEIVNEYLQAVSTYRSLAMSLPANKRSDKLVLAKREVINSHNTLQLFLKSLGEPMTKMYRSQLTLFPVIYQFRVRFSEELIAKMTIKGDSDKIPPNRKHVLLVALQPIVWDSEIPRREGQVRRLPREISLDDRGAYLQVEYNLHVFASQKFNERQESARQLRLSGLATIVATLLLLWIYVAQGRERERQEQLNKAERLRLEEEIRRQDAEKLHQEAERANLELKSQLWANIGIMAGSYAHNIKNLLVRPNDLLARCLETSSLPQSQGQMLLEVRSTLGTVTERLQQILQTVRRDPTSAERVRLDINTLLLEIRDTWSELADEKWKLTLELDLSKEPLWIEGDASHLQQAFENLLFNARDATFEMRNFLRKEARAKPDRSAHTGKKSAVTNGTENLNSVEQILNSPDKQKALIAAASWRGRICLRTRREGDVALVEIQDNGIGMTEEVRQQCTQTHFSTKRNNALFTGMSAGMGLGLSFVLVILEHHQARLNIESKPLEGANFVIHFPLETNSALGKGSIHKTIL